MAAVKTLSAPEGQEKIVLFMLCVWVITGFPRIAMSRVSSTLSKKETTTPHLAGLSPYTHASDLPFFTLGFLPFGDCFKKNPVKMWVGYRFYQYMWQNQAFRSLLQAFMKYLFLYVFQGMFIIRKNMGTICCPFPSREVKKCQEGQAIMLHSSVFSSFILRFAEFFFYNIGEDVLKWSF